MNATIVHDRLSPALSFHLSLAPSSSPTTQAFSEASSLSSRTLRGAAGVSFLKLLLGFRAFHGFLMTPVDLKPKP